jgi:hypothetical protein
MIELSLDVLKELSSDMNEKDDDEINAKYNIDVNELEDIISEHVEQSYVNNDIYHMFPIMTMGIVILNAVFFMYIKP